MLRVPRCCVAPWLPAARSAAPAAAPGTPAAWQCRTAGTERAQPTAPFCARRLSVIAEQLTLLFR